MTILGPQSTGHFIRCAMVGQSVGSKRTVYFVGVGVGGDWVDQFVTTKDFI